MLCLPSSCVKVRATAPTRPRILGTVARVPPFGTTGDIAPDAPSLLARGRRAFAQRDWPQARRLLAEADRAEPLEAADLELLSTAASMLGSDDWVGALERAYERHLADGDRLRAVRCAFWIGVRLARWGETARASGWLARAQRLLEEEGRECAEQGYLIIPEVFGLAARGELEAAAARAGAAADLGRRFGDRDLFALATHEQGHLLIRAGNVQEGLSLLDEAMVTVTERELSPHVTGIVYCGTISACQEVYEVRRAGEWTDALTRWCEDQHGLAMFAGDCQIHRAEVMQLHGAWQQALEEVLAAGEWLARREHNQHVAGAARYRAGELHRLRGELEQAEEAYRDASRFGREPQPGLALLRLGQGRADAAAAAIRRAVSETTEPLERARLLPARVEIALAVEDVDGARAACDELEELASRFPTRMLEAMAANARGAVELAGGDAGAALVALRRASRAWQELAAPYEAACARVLVALACRSLGDSDAVSLELEAAREAFERLGAQPDVAWVESLAGAPEARERFGLTARELEVLRLVAAGRTNREVADELVISEHTVARHVQNIFAKLGVSSRTAAGAFAHSHGLA
jgi:ATP/maltotriose-dependent transcriptional regulator MalT